MFVYRDVIKSVSNLNYAAPAQTQCFERYTNTCQASLMSGSIKLPTKMSLWLLNYQDKLGDESNRFLNDDSVMKTRQQLLGLNIYEAPVNFILSYYTFLLCNTVSSVTIWL